MRPNNKELTTFRTGMGAFKYKVLLFGLTNGPASFQSFINLILNNYLKDFYTAFIDNILIYSNTLKKYEIHIKKVLKKLKEAGLQADFKKYKFYILQTKFLGFIISRDGIFINPEKVAIVKD